jgi:MOSC domain-containing protein YiiM
VVGPLGIEGDAQAHPQIHGGPRQALLVITSEGIDDLVTLGFPLYYGALGENITTAGLDRRFFRVGQRWRVGSIVIEFTKIRQPCTQLDVYGPGIQRAVYDAAINAGDALSPRWGLSGFYASVVQTGTIRPGDPMVLLDQAA